MLSHGLKAGRRAGSRGQGCGSSRAGAGAEAESQLPEGPWGRDEPDNTWIMAGRGGGRNARSPLQGALKWGRASRQGWGTPQTHPPPLPPGKETQQQGKPINLEKGNCLGDTVNMVAMCNEPPHLQACVTPGRGTGLRRRRRADVTMWLLGSWWHLKCENRGLTSPLQSKRGDRVLRGPQARNRN